jgi:hypothetical protein
MTVQMMNWEGSGWKWPWDIIEINLDEKPKFENGKPHKNKPLHRAFHYVKFVDNFDIWAFLIYFCPNQLHRWIMARGSELRNNARNV